MGDLSGRVREASCQFDEKERKRKHEKNDGRSRARTTLGLPRCDRTHERSHPAVLPTQFSHFSLDAVHAEAQPHSMHKQHQREGQDRELYGHQGPVQGHPKRGLNPIGPPGGHFRRRGHRPADEGQEKREGKTRVRRRPPVNNCWSNCTAPARLGGSVQTWRPAVGRPCANLDVLRMKPTRGPCPSGGNIDHHRQEQVVSEQEEHC